MLTELQNVTTGSNFGVGLTDDGLKFVTGVITGGSKVFKRANAGELFTEHQTIAGGVRHFACISGDG